MNTTDGLILPALDRAFQDILNIPDATLHSIVNDHTRMGLLLSKKIISSPSFFIESLHTQKSILTSKEFLYTDHSFVSMREPNLNRFLLKKQIQYLELKANYNEYYEVNEQMLKHLVNVRRRNHEVGETISRKWLRDLTEIRRFNLLDSTDVFENHLRIDIINALKEVPNQLQGKPFVWENVVGILNRIVPNWRKQEFVHSLKLYLLKLYFDSLAEKNDRIGAFTDFFGWIETSDESIEHQVVPLFPLSKFLHHTGIAKQIFECNEYDFIKIINSEECSLFRITYFELLTAFGKSELYNKLLEACKRGEDYKSSLDKTNKFIRRIWNLLPDFIRRYYSEKKSVKSVLSNTSIENFICYFENQRSNFIDIDINIIKNYYFMSKEENNTFNNYGNVGAMGPHAKAENFIQSSNIENINMKELLPELLALKEELSKNAKDNAERIDEINSIENEINQGNFENAKGLLTKAGKWIYDFAYELGLHLLAKVVVGH